MRALSMLASDQKDAAAISEWAFRCGHAVAACNFNDGEPGHGTIRFNLLRGKKPFREIDHALRLIQKEFFLAGHLLFVSNDRLI